MDSIKIDQHGIARPALFIASPNYDARPGTAITLAVIHNISLPPGQYGGNGVIELFTNRLDADAHPYYAGIHQLKVSAHFFIRRDGSLLQFVPCNQRAWHAGVSSWQGRERCNDYSIGIELEGSDDDAFTAEQYATLNHLLAALKTAYPIQDVVGHSDIAPGRKTDPGPCFDWSQITGTCLLRQP
ncbi:MAG TPA: 1,6-anhydro-N-acetylmuramyl-L-alanine amidase AmpD [Methylophilaceae bacterium]|nr:1,6-anhydro-N-acetylmuramyl-L-alanine amidase AmpD [Methylophilaceae bacterium]